MSFSIEFADETQTYQAKIKVVGVGGSGGNAINTMIHFGLEGVEFITVNTDAQALNANAAAVKIPIGGSVTRGLGAGADPERGRKAALEDVTRLKEAISGADMVFVTAGMGGGTGTGAAPVIAQLAREEGALTVGVVTKPFIFEGRQRSRRADQGLSMLAEHVDTLITIPNEKLMTLADDELTFVDAFRKADEVLYQAVRGISDLITLDGIVNVDFADVRTVMACMGRALMGTGCAKGEGRARLAAEHAITSPLLDNISVEGATGVLINVVGGPDMKMREIQEAASLIQEQAHEDANIIFGASIDETMGDAIKVTVIATGFEALGEEIPVEVPREAPRTVPQGTRRDALREGFASAPPSRAALTSKSPERESAPAYSTRRPAALAASLQAGANSSALPAVRDRITFPSSLDHDDWDTPAFQRRGSG
ncbi:MAG: cell division protein FtsZ [Myxococcales bacterium]|nr:cell division protein FtsZ [Myxococcales bacterium]MCB9577968.1 cell division protein FtsZ [Polyangiaceae bacterium]